MNRSYDFTDLAPDYTMPTTLEQLVDRQEIVDTVQRFCWMIDTHKPLSEFTTAAQIFTEDLQFGLVRETVKSSDEIKLIPMGRDAFAAFINKVQKKYKLPEETGPNPRATPNPQRGYSQAHKLLPLNLACAPFAILPGMWQRSTTARTPR